MSRFNLSQNRYRLGVVGLGGEVVIIVVTAASSVMANNTVERVVSTLVGGDNTRRTNRTRSNPALTLFGDWVFIQPRSGGVINGTLITEGSIAVGGAIRVVAEFLGELVVASTDGYWLVEMRVHDCLADFLASCSVSTDCECIPVMRNVRGVVHPFGSAVQCAVYLRLFFIRQSGPLRLGSWTWFAFGVSPLRLSLGLSVLLPLSDSLSFGLVIRFLVQGSALGCGLAFCLMRWCPDLGDSVHDLLVCFLLLGFRGGLVVRLGFLNGDDSFAQMVRRKNTTDESRNIRIACR